MKRPIAGHRPNKYDDPCSVEDCTKKVGKHGGRGYCAVHLKNGKNCSVTGCGRVYHSGGYCWRHIEMVRNGESLDMPLRVSIQDPRARIEYYSAPRNENGCRLWTGSQTGTGYGQTYPPPWGTSRKAHRLAYELANDVRLTPDQVVHHKCGVSLCVEPEHLQIVEPHENSAEMLERNRLYARVNVLERALAELDPEHELLADRRPGPL